MATKCYAMVRGSAIRVTGLGPKGQLGDPAISYAVSKSVAKVTVNEVTESASNEMLKNDEDEPRLHFVRSAATIRHTVDIDFLRVDPGVFAIVAGMVQVSAYRGAGFGEGAFGEMPFGGGEPFSEEAFAVIEGFDADTKRAPAVFALEVWSKLAGQQCADGTRQYGYTLFPFLKGGRLSGFSFHNGLVSFSLRAAQTRRVSRWGVGPYDLEGTHERLLKVVSRNSSFQNFITPAVPPTETCGIQETTDVIEGGTAGSTTEDIVDGEFVVTSPWIIDGGGAL